MTDGGEIRSTTELAALPPAERASAILASPRARDLVRSLPAPDLYLMIVEAGPDAALELLPLAATPQLEFAFDVDAWEGSEIDPARFGRWLVHLRDADPELLVRALLEVDEGLLVLALSRLIHVYKLDESTDPSFWPPEDRALATLDGLYFIEPRDGIDDEVALAVWEGLSRLQGQSTQIYAALLEQVLWIIPAEQEEEAYERRRGRLEEHGFPDLEEAQEVWAAGAVEDPAVRARIATRLGELPLPEGLRADPPAGGALVLPRLGRAEASGPLAVAVASLPETKRRGFEAGLARLATRFAAASGEHLGSPDTHRRGALTAISHVRLALDELGARAPEEVARAIAQIPAAELCRIGTGAVQERAARARHLAQHGFVARLPAARERLEDELADTLEALVARRPGFAAAEGPRPFRSREDLERTDERLDVIEGLGSFVEQRLGAERVEALDRELEADAAERPPWSAVALTSVARASLTGRLDPAPLSPVEAREALDRLLEPDVPRRAAGELRTRLHDAGLRGACARHLVHRLEEDAAHLPRGVAVSPNAIGVLVVKRPSPKN